MSTLFLPNSKTIRVLIAMIITILWGILPLQVHADDTEVYFNPNTDDRPPANVLLALDTSLSMQSKKLANDPEDRTRLQVMRQVVSDFLESADNINIGMMRFNGSFGGGAIVHPIAPIDQTACSADGCNIRSVIAKISSDDDDAEQRHSSGQVFLNNFRVTLGQVTNDFTKLKVGLRFDNLRVPSGVTIKSARLVVEAGSNTATPSDLSISAEYAGSSTEFTSETNNLTDRPTDGNATAWPAEAWSQNSTYESPDISNLIQSVVQRPDWCSGNALTLFVDGSGNRSIKTYNGGSDRHARLLIEYDTSNPSPSPGCFEEGTVEKRINASTDDARETTDTGGVLLIPGDSTAGRFFLSHEAPVHNGITGLRFSDMDIPQGAVITEAYLEFTTMFNGREDGNLTIRGLSGDNPPPFVNQAYNISSRPTTGSNVIWQDVPRVGRDGTLRSPNIAPVIQEVVNQGTWNAGDALGFRVDSDNTFRRRIYSYDTDTAFAPKLFVKYLFGGAQAELAHNTVRDDLLKITDDLSAEGGTPITDVLYEAANYFRGANVDFGKKRGDDWIVNGQVQREYSHQYHRIAHPDSYTGGTPVTPPQCIGEGREEWNPECRDEVITGDPVYISPIESQCQPNSIVLLSDSEPGSVPNYDHLVELLGTHEECNSSTKCINALAEYLSTRDHAPNIVDNQTVTIHTIGFADGNNSKLTEAMQGIAAAGGGQYFSALTANELSTVLDNLQELNKVTNTTFPIPGAAVNQFNRLSDEDSIYFSLFEPTQGPAWPGNLKKYNLLTNDDDTVGIVDAKDDPAIDPDTGFFFDTARSEWSDTTDGNDVAAGGAASKIQTYDNFSGPRKVYTYTGTNAPNNADLTEFSNTLSEDNRAITDAMLNIEGESNDYRTQLLLWARGVDVFDENGDGSTRDSRTHMGDPLHSGPIAVNYAAAGGVNPYLFVTTNEGYLHVVDAKTGKEEFSFVPQELLENLNRLQENSVTGSHIYGLDGQLSFYFDDTNENRLVDSDETALLFFGMRRGGSNYYALDVANLSSPKLKWVIKGGADGTPGFEELAQTWARAEVAKIQTGSNTTKTVLVMGAGYDPNQDDTPNNPTLPRRADSRGRGIFIVDALTGERLWSASPIANGNNHEILRDLKYSIPSSVSVIDIDDDGLSDQMYVGDTGGQIWRFDFSTDPNSTLLAQGGLIADFGGNAAKEARRFYYPPDMALVHKKNQLFLSLGIGTGWRAHPLDDVVEDRYYALQMPIRYGPQADYGKAIVSGNTTYYSPYLESDLLDVTENFAPDEADINNASGWMRRMNFDGEKVLSNSITVDNKIFFTSYEPDFDDNELCSVAAGVARIYAVNAFDGSPVKGFANDGGSYGLGSPSEEDLYQELDLSAIPSNPNITSAGDGKAVLHVGTEVIDGVFEEKSGSGRTWWMEAVSE